MPLIFIKLYHHKNGSFQENTESPCVSVNDSEQNITSKIVPFCFNTFCKKSSSQYLKKTI